MEEQLKNIKADALKDIQDIKDKLTLVQVNAKFLGKNGTLSSLMRGLKDISPEQRPIIGAKVNEVRDVLLNALKDKESELEHLEILKQIEHEKVDVTIPVKPSSYGTLHPLELIKENIFEYFLSKGYSVVDGLDIESDYYNFEALNVPKDHPARDAQDTFYFSADRLLRTQTSSVQIRTMKNTQPPIKIVTAGSVYRVDEIDNTHSPLFNQLEILVVDRGITMSDLKGTLTDMVKHLLGDKAEIRMRPSYFPFTEPSVEVDATCVKCGGKGCPTCKEEGVIELLGGGVVQPCVLEECGIDSKEYSGFAVGIGLERLAMLKYGIGSIRDFYENDIRFLKQFK